MITPEDILRLVDATDLPVPSSSLKVDMPFKAQGLDSLDVATLMVEVETTYKKVIDPEQMAQLRSVNDIVNFLNT
jgi:acyl carrier protein